MLRISSDNKSNQGVKVKLTNSSKETWGEIAGTFAGIFVLLQIAGTLYQIFILEQLVLDSDAQNAAFLMIGFCVAKIAYTMTIIFYLFIVTPETVVTIRIVSFVIAAAQISLSVYLITTYYDQYINPVDPESISDIYALMISAAYSIELFVFVVMIISFIVILFQVEEQEPKKKAAPVKYAYYYVPQACSNLNSENNNDRLLNERPYNIV